MYSLLPFIALDSTIAAMQNSNIRLSRVRWPDQARPSTIKLERAEMRVRPGLFEQPFQGEAQ
jgi:hypothetical protein